MPIIIHRAHSRGFADHGWLKSCHTFSFADYYNPERMNFGLLRVLNDDVIEPGRGFGTHPHDNMEIISIPIFGALKHKDSMSNELTITHGEVQRMSAGTGIRHSEFNSSDTDPVNLLQIWILPKKKNIVPSYGQKQFNVADRQNKFQILVAPDEREGSLWINQDAFLSQAFIKAGKAIAYQNYIKGQGIYVFVIEGEISVSGETLGKRDAIGITDVESLAIIATQNSDVLVIEVPL